MMRRDLRTASSRTSATSAAATTSVVRATMMMETTMAMWAVTITQSDQNGGRRLGGKVDLDRRERLDHLGLAVRAHVEVFAH